jgi:undecaprenyl-phosphate 4-deoxy-4-formamido-L-arabinose transferase
MTEWMLKKTKDLYISSFFVCKRYVVDEILKYENAYPYVIGLVLRTTSRIANVKVNHAERVVGQSGYSILKLFSLWMNGFTAFSVKPLRIADFIGVLLSLSGFGYAIYLIIKRLIVGYSFVVGWNSLMCVILILGGIIVLILGLVGEYIGRIYICSNKAPQYVIRKHCSK